MQHKYDTLELKPDDIKDLEKMVHRQFPLSNADQSTYVLECDAQRFLIKGSAAKKVGQYMNDVIKEVLKCNYPPVWEDKFKHQDQDDDMRQCHKYEVKRDSQERKDVEAMLKGSSIKNIKKIERL